jgi:Uma2 family endonuclease
MSTLATSHLGPPAVYTREPIFPLTVDQYHELIRSGKLTDEDPVELLEGILVFKMPKNAPHATSNSLVRQQIESLLPSGWHYRSQEPITLSDSEPEPDGAVVRGSMLAYSARHPGVEDIALVIEDADTSLQRDRELKQQIYARAGITQYWIANLNERQLEVHLEPVSAGPEPRYRQVSAYLCGSVVPLVIGGQPCGSISVSALFA